MNKQEFLKELEKELSALPREDTEERLAFYNEMIDDMVEEGKTEEQAVAEIGSAADIAKQTLSGAPAEETENAQGKPKPLLKVLMIILIILGFPLWFSILIAGVSGVLALYITVWSLLIGLWAIEASLIVFAAGSAAQAVALMAVGFGTSGIATLGMGVFAAGVSVFLFYGCLAASKGVIKLTKNAFIKIKSLFRKKEGAK
ncbi:MAG: DUF1700 domain-containing protein [Clostridia bacterium]|nr:DUF1700 domain-containing protein [Clostridia bacterium]